MLQFLFLEATLLKLPLSTEDIAFSVKSTLYASTYLLLHQYHIILPPFYLENTIHRHLCVLRDAVVMYSMCFTVAFVCHFSCCAPAHVVGHLSGLR